ncbi:MAG: 16S rRNA (cytosine(1402)-N(4))-methyltransferase RsmH [Ilumatobacteraceae bacterium]
MSAMTAPDFTHVPVMLDEVSAVFDTVPTGVVVDATAGGAGHATAILDAHPGISVVAVDQDPSAVAVASERLERFGDRAKVRRARFDRVVDVLDELGIERISGALFDLGVSSHQFDTPERGFSYRAEAPLDMRMDTDAPRSAHHVVNESSAEELTSLLRDLADERFAARIARAIVAARPIDSTVHLAEIVAAAIPAPARRRGGHPAKRTFQAIRIAVNSELDLLAGSLRAVVERSRPGARIAVLSYHSGEDRIVKAEFRALATGGCHCPVGLPCGCGAVPVVRAVRAASSPSASEIERNPRGASARLRVVEVL